MGKYAHIKNYSVFNGLDLRSSEVTRPRGFARECLNTMRGPTGSLDTRYGTKLRGSAAGCFGVWPYDATNMLSTAVSEVLHAGSGAVGNNHELFRQTTGTVQISNAGASVTVSLYWDTATSQFRCRIVRGGSTLLNQALGTGLEASPYTIGSLVTAINGISGMGAAASGNTGDSAAYLDVIDDQVIGTPGTYNATFGVLNAVNRPRFIWPISAASSANDTIAMSATVGGSKYPNPLRNGDQVYLVGSSLPSPLVEGTIYYVVSNTADTIKLAATQGGSPINLTTDGSAFYLMSDAVNPGATFWNYIVEFGLDSFRPISSVQLRGCRYFTAGRVTPGTGADGSMLYRENAGLSKYDGQSFYRAGLPPYRETTNPSPGAQVTSASQTDCKGTFSRHVSAPNAPVFDHPYYDYQYKYIDKIGNTIEGALHGEYDSGTLYATPQTGAWALHLYKDGNFPWLISRLGFNSNYAVKNSGSTSGLTYTVDNGFGSNRHTMQVGDIAYFWDARQSRFIQREVTARTSTTMTVAATSLDQDPTSPTYDDGGTPTVNPFAAFSANLRVVIWRSIGQGSAGAIKYLVTELPWNPVYDVYYDDATDDEIQLNGPMVEKPYEPSLPPPSRYLAVQNGQLVSTGDDANPLTVSFEDIETPEGMPLGTHSFDLERNARGIAQTGGILMAGTDRKISVVTGDLSEFKFRVEDISDSIGIMAHESIRQVEEGLTFFESTIGPYAIIGGRQLQPLGAMTYLDGMKASRVEPYFTADYSNATYKPAFHRAIATVLPKDRLYILFIPLEQSNRYGFASRAQSASTGSLAFVFDYGRGEWFRWAGIDFSSMCEKDGALHYGSRRFTGFNGSNVDYRNLDSSFGKLVRDKGKYNYSDHELPLTWTFQNHWESLGKPALFKRGIRCRISAAPLLVNPTPLTVKSYVDFDTSLVSTSTVISWDTRQDYKVKLNAETCRGIMMEFGSSEYYKPFSLTGYELELSADFKEIFKE